MGAPFSIVWPGGEHLFRLNLGEIRALQDSCGSSPFEVAERLFTRKPKINDVIETLRLGLIGGGMKQDEAGRLVKSIEDLEGLGGLIPAASLVMFNSLYREAVGQDTAGETTAGPETKAPDPASSTFERSTASEP
jgi:hypothetical protein